MLQQQQQQQQQQAQLHHMAQQLAQQAQQAQQAQLQLQQNLTALKKDKRRQTILNKLTKLEEKFHEEKDFYYRNNLHDLQLSLSTLHNNTNDECLTRIEDFRELRDAELTRLRLGEEYLVYRTANLFKYEYEKTQESYDNLIKQVKQKLYEKINKKIVNLKQEKLLMDVSTSMTHTQYSNSRGYLNGVSNSNGSRSRRREDSQRKRAAIETDYDSGYDSTGYTSLHQNHHSGYDSSQSNHKKKKTGTRIATDDDFDQNTMDELDELLNEGSETQTGGHHTTRAQSHSITFGNKKHKTVADSMRPLDDEDVSSDLKLMKNL